MVKVKSLRLVILQRRWCWSANTLFITLVITLVIDVIKELLILILTKISMFSSWNHIMRSSLVMRMFILVWCSCLWLLWEWRKILWWRMVLLVKWGLLGTKKKNHYGIIVVCMKYKCQRHLVFQDCCMKTQDHWGPGCCTVMVVEAVVVVVDMTVVETMVVVEE